MDLYFSPLACSLATRIALYEAGAEANYLEVDPKTKVSSSYYELACTNQEGFIVATPDKGGDAQVFWGDAPLHPDVTSHGPGFYTTIFTLYSATSGTADLFASHVTAGDLTINAYAVTNLAPSALDKMAAAQGTGTSPSSGATGITSHANELLWGTIGYSGNDRATGTWIDGFTSGGQFKSTGGISGVEDGYKTVSSTAAYTAAKAGINKDTWTAVIATYAISAGRDPTR